MKLSLCLATYNEEANLAACLESAKNIVDEIVIVDGNSTDKTVEIAKSFGARVIITKNPPMFHINKQKALEAAKGEWILQLDADERLSPTLAKEITAMVQMRPLEREQYQNSLPKRKLFLRHQALVEELQGKVGEKEGEYVAFFLPRLNFFLGKYLRHGGVYPDGAIRLVKKGKAHFPCKDVHEVMKVDGRVGWLHNDLLHYDSPTFKRYMDRNNRYINMIAKELKVKSQKSKVKNTTQKSKTKSAIEELITAVDWLFIKPVAWFFSTQIRHKGILDGWQGIVFSFFSALRFPRAYMQYIFHR